MNELEEVNLEVQDNEPVVLEDEKGADEDDEDDEEDEEGEDEEEEDDEEGEEGESEEEDEEEEEEDNGEPNKQDIENEELIEKPYHDIETEDLLSYHPKIKQHNYEEILARVPAQRDEEGRIVDPYHKTVPILTRYEQARILGTRAKQINYGASPMVPVPTDMLDGYEIAVEELKARVIPFIIRRPLPNGESEYWRVSDLDLIDY